MSQIIQKKALKIIMDKNPQNSLVDKNPLIILTSFVKEKSSVSPPTTCNFCRRGGYISNTCPLRKSLQKTTTLA